MNSFFSGFEDELEKLAVVGSVAKGGAGVLKFLWKHPYATSGLIGGVTGGMEGARRAAQVRRAAKSIRPSRAFYTNYHRALGIPRRMSKLEKRRLFAHSRRTRRRQRA